jgi:septum formation protein
MLLRAAGIEFTVTPSHVDEEAVTAALGPVVPVVDLVAHLARAKAEDVASRFVTGDHLIVGCDSMLEFEGLAHGKPLTADAARERWLRMRGKSGVLHTGHHVMRVRDGDTHTAAHAVVSTEVDFAHITDDEIDAYVATGEPLLVAGAFTLDSKGSAFVSGVRGDHANVVGLSLAALRILVREVGVEWTALWTTAPTPAPEH